MSFKKTLFFFLIFAGVFSYIYFVEIPKEVESKASVSLLAGAIPKEVREIEINNSGEKIILASSFPNKSFSNEERDSLKLEPLSKEEQNSWKIQGMETVPVDGLAVGTYLSVLGGITLGEPLPKEEITGDLKPFGLDSPSLSIGIKAGDKTKKVLFGKESEYLSKRYIKFEGDDRIFLTSIHQLSNLEKTKEDFRRKKLLDLTEPQIEKITLRRSGKEVELAQDTTENKWRISSPIQAVAGRVAIGSLIRELNELSATKLVEFGEAVSEEKYGLNNPETEIIIKEKDKDPYSVKILRKNRESPPSSSADEDVYLRVSNLGLIGETKPNPSFRVAPDLKDLREKNQFPISPFQTTKVIVAEKGKPEVVLEMKENEWWVGDKKGDSVFINEYIQKLAKTQAIGFPDSSASISDPVLTVSVFTKDGSSKVLQVGHALDSGGRIAHALEMFTIDSKAYEGLMPKVETLLPLEGEVNTK